MHLILSRKGFDSSPACGGCASPILPDGQMISLPIPHASGRTPFSGVKSGGHDVGQMVADLSNRRVGAGDLAHLDPDLEHSARRRRAGWRPAFGQDRIAQRHLDRMGVSAGDLFLFFGWFREVAVVRGRYRYRAGAPDLHVIFGWLRVGQVLRLGPDPIPAWLADHPHAGADSAPFNTVYAARGPDGGGMFAAFHDDRRLTEPGSPRRSVWHLPADFLPGSRAALTYHGEPSRWTRTDHGCRLRSVAKGQEFVLTLDDYPGVRCWAEGLLPQQADVTMRPAVHSDARSRGVSARLPRPRG
jgi:hypothetical protein